MANITLDKLKTIVQSIVASVTRYKPNLAVNDPDDPRYVAGRLCYKTVKAVDDVPETTVTFAESEGLYASTEMLPIPSVQAVGDVRTVVWDGAKYVCKAADYGGGMGYTLGNLSILAAAMGETAPDTGEPFVWMVIPQYGVSTLVTADTAETHTVRCYGEKEVIHELPQEYLPQIPAEKLPDLGLANVAYSGSYNDLDDKPTIPTDMVRYTVQNLTTTQKAQARTNIGAGTSSFDGAYSSLTGTPTLAQVAISGSYNDLTDKPTIPSDTVKYTAQSLTTAQKTQARTNIGADDYNNLDNRPCFVETTNERLEIFSSPVLSNGTYYKSYSNVTYELKEGAKYTVQYNGTYYENLVCMKVDTTISAYKSYVVGNPIRITGSHLAADRENTGEMFGIEYLVKPSGNTCTYQGYASGGCTLYEVVETIGELDERFIPATIQRVGEPLYLTDSAGAKWQLVVGTDGTLSTTAATE